LIDCELHPDYELILKGTEVEVKNLMAEGGIWIKLKTNPGNQSHLWLIEGKWVLVIQKEEA
jgi:hypothetical protein